MNVKSNPLMSQDKVRHDVQRAAKTGEIIGWQEIGPERYKDAIRNLKGFDTFMPKGLETPISWKKSEFKLLDSGVKKMHGGLAKVSPHRQVAWVKLQNKETGETVIHMNTHLVSGAFNSKVQRSDPWRKKMWALHIEVPWYGGLLMLVITAIGIMVPAAPGYIGTMNLACVAGLALFSVGRDQSVPFSWFYWAGQWIPVSAVGLLCLRREGLSLRSLERVGEEPA